MQQIENARERRVSMDPRARAAEDLVNNMHGLNDQAALNAARRAAGMQAGEGRRPTASISWNNPSAGAGSGIDANWYNQ
jgi:hypothetical protein